MNSSFKEELVRNFLGFMLLLCGIGLVHLGAHAHIDKETDAGYGFIGASLLALQVKRAEAPKDKLNLTAGPSES